MKKRNKFLFLGTLVLIFSIGCSNEKENKNLVEKNNTNITLINELKPISNSKTVYSIDTKNYKIDTLPKNYLKLTGKKRKIFLDFYIKYKLTLDSLKEEQKEYKNLLDKKIKTELEKIDYRGINQSELEKILYIQRLKLEKIALKEVEKQEENLTKRVEQVYERNQNKFKYPNTVELSFIVLKDKKKALSILNQMDIKNTKISEFSLLANKNSTDKKSRFTNGYAGYMTESSAGSKLFNIIWKYNKLGLIGEVLEKKDKFLLVFILKKIKAGKRTLSDVSEEIKEKLLHKKRNIWIAKRYQKIINSTKVKIYDSFENNQTFK